ncbi:hypothetical protein YC2023_073349 [Brassica napus]
MSNRSSSNRFDYLKFSASWADVADSEKAASRAKPAYVPTHLRNMQSEPVAPLLQNDRPGYGGQPSRWAPGGGVGGGGGYRNDVGRAGQGYGLARQLSASFLGKVIEGVWHTGIVVYGNEYFFGGGIQHLPAGTTPYGAPLRTVELGETHVPKDVFEMYLEEISPRYTAESYNLLAHNCNNFSNEVAQFLVGKGIPNYILELPNEVMNSPIGGLISKLQSFPAPNNKLSKVKNTNVGLNRDNNNGRRFGFDNNGRTNCMGAMTVPIISHMTHKKENHKLVETNYVKTKAIYFCIQVEIILSLCIRNVFDVEDD